MSAWRRFFRLLQVFGFRRQQHVEPAPASRDRSLSGKARIKARRADRSNAP